VDRWVWSCGRGLHQVGLLDVPCPASPRRINSRVPHCEWKEACVTCWLVHGLFSLKSGQRRSRRCMMFELYRQLWWWPIETIFVEPSQWGDSLGPGMQKSRSRRSGVGVAGGEAPSGPSDPCSRTVPLSRVTLFAFIASLLILSRRPGTRTDS